MDSWTLLDEDDFENSNYTREHLSDALNLLDQYTDGDEVQARYISPSWAQADSSARVPVQSRDTTDSTYTASEMLERALSAEPLTPPEMQTMPINVDPDDENALDGLDVYTKVSEEEGLYAIAAVLASGSTNIKTGERQRANLYMVGELSDQYGEAKQALNER